MTQITRGLDALLDDLFASKDIHSALLAVASGDGTFRWMGARGSMLPGGESVTPASPWFVASITKLFIAATLMRHASGLPDFIEDYRAKGSVAQSDGRSLVEILVEDGDRPWGLDDTVCWVRGRLFRDANTWSRMLEGWRHFGLPLDRAALRQPSWPIQYGLGVMRFQPPRLFTPFRRIPEMVGHTGSTGAWLFHSPRLDLYLTGTVNQITAGAVPFRVVPQILKAVAEGKT